MDYYEILQVSPNAEASIIQAAYERLAQKYNPAIDSSPMAAAKLRDLSAAFSILGDPLSRAEYDRRRNSPQQRGDEIKPATSVKTRSSRGRWILIVLIFLCVAGFFPSAYRNISSQLRYISLSAATPLPLTPARTAFYIIQPSDLPPDMNITFQQQSDATLEEIASREPSPGAEDALTKLGYQGGTVVLYLGTMGTQVELIASYVYVFKDANGADKFFDLNEASFRSQYTSVENQRAPQINGTENVAMLRTQGKKVNDLGTKNVIVLFRKGNV